jgi:hypothetical protein
VRQGERKRLGERGVRGLTGGSGFERERPLVPAGSGEGFHRPGDVIQRGKRGKMEREEWAICSHDVASNQEGIEEGAKISPALSLRGINGWTRTMMMCPGGWGLHISEWREKWCTDLERNPGGLWATSFARPKGFLEALFFLFPFLFFFYFLISISFINFSNLVQIDSKQFVNFSKIQLNNLGQ